MNAARYVLVLALGLLAARPAARNDPSEIAAGFLPPGGETAEIYRVNTKTGTVTERTPAILPARIVSANSNDIVLAYYSPGSPPATDKSLFVDLLHEGQSGYVKV